MLVEVERGREARGPKQGGWQYNPAAILSAVLLSDNLRDLCLDMKYIFQRLLSLVSLIVQHV